MKTITGSTPYSATTAGTAPKKRGAFASSFLDVPVTGQPANAPSSDEVVANTTGSIQDSIRASLRFKIMPSNTFIVTAVIVYLTWLVGHPEIRSQPIGNMTFWTAFTLEQASHYLYLALAVQYAIELLRAQKSDKKYALPTYVRAFISLIWNIAHWALFMVILSQVFHLIGTYIGVLIPALFVYLALTKPNYRHRAWLSGTDIDYLRNRAQYGDNEAKSRLFEAGLR